MTPNYNHCNHCSLPFKVNQELLRNSTPSNSNVTLSSTNSAPVTCSAVRIVNRFPSPIVSGGSNSANPHASPSERKLQAGDLLLFDWGAAYEGYISDPTGTFAVGEIDPKFEKIHRIVQEANAAGRAAGKPGVPAANVDFAAREVITKAGSGEYFRHRTGHGIGMEVHEDPYVRDEDGVRVEDNMVVTKTGAESLSKMPREIRIIGSYFATTD